MLIKFRFFTQTMEVKDMRTALKVLMALGILGLYVGSLLMTYGMNAGRPEFIGYGANLNLALLFPMSLVSLFCFLETYGENAS